MIRVKNVEMISFIALFSGSPNSPTRIVCIRVQWNHADLSGCTPRGGVLAGRLLGNVGWVQLSEAEEPVDTHLTVNVVDTFQYLLSASYLKTISDHTKDKLHRRRHIGKSKCGKVGIKN